MKARHFISCKNSTALFPQEDMSRVKWNDHCFRQVYISWKSTDSKSVTFRFSNVTEEAACGGNAGAEMACRGFSLTVDEVLDKDFSLEPFMLHEIFVVHNVAKELLEFFIPQLRLATNNCNDASFGVCH